MPIVIRGASRGISLALVRPFASPGRKADLLGRHTRRLLTAATAVSSSLFQAAARDRQKRMPAPA